LCWFSTLLRGFFSGYSGFPPSAKTDTQLIRAGCWLCSKVMHGPYSGCQRHLHILLVRPCRAASLLYFARAISETVIYINNILVLAEHWVKPWIQIELGENKVLSFFILNQ